MTDKNTLKNEFLISHRKQAKTGPNVLDKNEAFIIVTALASLTAALIVGQLSEDAFTGLMGTFLGYTFGRIFNHWQGKE